VVKEPEHPYTRLLIGSIPRPDPKHHWGIKEKAPDRVPSGRSNNGAGGSAGRQGCHFADRCPNVMAMCREKTPPLYQTAPHRATACYLYRDSPVAAPEKLSEIFVARA